MSAPLLPRWSVRWAVCFIAVGLAAWIQWQSPHQFARFDAALRDGYLRIQADSRKDDRLVVIDINEDSLQQLGQWPWPRARLADLVEIALTDGAARAVALDMVLPESADNLGDRRLAALAEHAPLTLAQVMDFSPREIPNRLGVLASGHAPEKSPTAVAAMGYIANHAGLAHARCVGNIGYLPDSDGVLRHTPALTQFEKTYYLPLAAALMRCANPQWPQPGANAAGLWRIPFGHAIESYTVLSAADVLAGKVDLSLFQNRFVLIGSSALGLSDRVATPLQALAPGLFVHAEAISGLLDIAQGKARAPWDASGWMLGWTALSALSAVLAVASLAAWHGTLLLLGLTLAWLAIAGVGIAMQAEFSVSAPLAAYFVVFFTAIPYEWWQSQGRARRLVTTFSHYVAQPVLDEILRLGLKHSLTPTLREVTVLIADMQGYTQATSDLSLDEAARLTKEFLGCLTTPVLTHGGTLDKYTGDGLVAFWGAPVPAQDHADRAVQAAMDIVATVDLWNEGRMAEGKSALRVRIGVESGPALVGDLGTPFRSTYTAVGDCINFASRLEAAARDLSTNLVIGPHTQAMLRRHRTRSLGLIHLRGVSDPLEVFGLQ